MKYQLVLQFAATNVSDFDELVALEEVLIRNLPVDSEVDGHDVGAGEFNIFLFTNDPNKAFTEAQKIVAIRIPDRQFKAGYRAVDSDDYFQLWPYTSEAFHVS